MMENKGVSQAKVVTEQSQKQLSPHESIWTFFLILVWPKQKQDFKCLCEIVNVIWPSNESSI